MKNVLIIFALFYFTTFFCSAQTNIFELTEVADGQITAPVADKDPINFKWNENGTTKSLMEEGKNKVIFLNFFGSWCGPCNSEAPTLVTIYNKFKDKAFFMIAYDFEDGSDAFEALKEFVNNYNIEYPNLTTTNSTISTKIYNAYQVQYVPMTYIISPQGKIVYSTVGAVDENEITTLIENQLKNVAVNETNYSNSVNVFPNPVITGEIANVQIQLSENSNINIELFDMFGNKVKDSYSSQNCFGNLTVPFSLSGLSSGVYFIKIEVNGKHQTRILHKE